MLCMNIESLLNDTSILHLIFFRSFSIDIITHTANNMHVVYTNDLYVNEILGFLGRFKNQLRISLISKCWFFCITNKYLLTHNGSEFTYNVNAIKANSSHTHIERGGNER